MVDRITPAGQRIAVVGIGLRYPDANDRSEFWENVLAGRRAFRNIPAERLNPKDYFDPDPDAADKHYSTKAALIKDFEFDRAAFRVSGATFRSTDMTHWLALTVATEALADAGGTDGVDKARIGVVVGNTLTGEFARANLMRMRWPYVRRVAASVLSDRGMDPVETTALLAEFEAAYKEPFPAADADTLAGGLSNTIAGRICNHLDLGGGGYTVDGACSSSLLAITTAAAGLCDGRLDMAVAGGVDLSVDPFELIGFAKTSALTRSEMRVYDRASNGFWPGEGCGVVVLMREHDAVADGRPIYAVITGWGVSSDGRGGITRPEAGGHRRALADAYVHAGYPISSVGYFEGHGTGTAVGDETEIEAIASALSADGPPGDAPAALGTVKGNIGHTKAAAGVAGFIKATLALHHRVVPPATSHHDPHPALERTGSRLAVPTCAQSWPPDERPRAGVSSMGFGGINAHIALEAHGAGDPTELALAGALWAGRQDVELLLFAANDRTALGEQIDQIAKVAAGASFAEISDLAAALAVHTQGSWRAAAVVRDADHAVTALATLARVVAENRPQVNAPAGMFFGSGERAPRIAFAFPGQGNGAIRRGAAYDRFATAAAIADRSGLGRSATVRTDDVQPRVAAACLAGLAVLRDLGIDAHCAFGHSLGELVALTWAGAIPEERLLDLVTLRGRRMADLGPDDTGMTSLDVDVDTARSMIGGSGLAVCAMNSARRTVVGGRTTELRALATLATAQGVRVTALPVSHAFHSPAMAAASRCFAQDLAGFDLVPPSRRVLSTVTGRAYDDHDDVVELLRDQFSTPVRFIDAATTAAAESDLIIEIGPGSSIRSLLAETTGMPPVLTMDMNSPTLAPVLSVVAAGFVLGAPTNVGRLFADRLTRPVSLTTGPQFFASPCEAAPEVRPAELVIEPSSDAASGNDATALPTVAGVDTLAFLTRTVAQRLELPLSAVTAQTRPVDDLHLSSITVGQIANEVTTALGRPPLSQTTSLATVNLGELARAIEDAQDEVLEIPTGVADWTRVFGIELVPDTASHIPVVAAAPDRWTVFGADTAAGFIQALTSALPGPTGDGAILLGVDGAPDHQQLLDATRLAAARDGHLVIVQQGGTVAGFARAAHLEHRGLRVTVADLADDVALTAELARTIAEDAAATRGYREIHHAASGRLGSPVLTVRELHPAGDLPVGPDDVVLASGGGKSITFECAFELARRSGCRLVLLGRSDPVGDEELDRNLARARTQGIVHEYVRCDVSNDAAVAAAVNVARDRFGPVTVVLHGAGRNEPTAIASLTPAEIAATEAPKVQGLRNLLDACAGHLRMVVTFGSIIGRAGLRGEAHYALANDRLTDAALRFGRANRGVRVLPLEWSVWSGAGMGERLGVIEALQRAGVTPIGVDEGVRTFIDLVADPQIEGPLVITGRTGVDWPTVTHRRPEPRALARFLDNVVAEVSGVELIADAELSVASDPYLRDHAWDGNLLFPSVIALEAMTQVGRCLFDEADRPAIPEVRSARFERPIVVPVAGWVTIRVAALRTGPHTVEVVIRSSETGFGVDHMRAELHLGTSPSRALPLPSPAPALHLDPTTDLYGPVMFQGPRFQVVRAYREIHARSLQAELCRAEEKGWFGPLLPAAIIYSQPDLQDAVMHAIQVCIPTATLLPEGIDVITHDGPAPGVGETLRLVARERCEVDGLFTYDADLRRTDGSIWQTWRGLHLRAVRSQALRPRLPFALLTSVIERGLEKLSGRIPTLAADRAGDGGTATSGRPETSELLARIGVPADMVTYRPDGKPESVDGRTISASHSGPFTIVSVGPDVVAVDVETVCERDWDGLLPSGSTLARTIGDLVDENLDVSATRVWCATECLRKAGAPGRTVVFDANLGDGWVTLRSGPDVVATLVVDVIGRAEPTVLGALVRGA